MSVSCLLLACHRDVCKDKSPTSSERRASERSVRFLMETANETVACSGSFRGHGIFILSFCAAAVQEVATSQHAPCEKRLLNIMALRLPGVPQLHLRCLETPRTCRQDSPVLFRVLEFAVCKRVLRSAGLSNGVARRVQPVETAAGSPRKTQGPRPAVILQSGAEKQIFIVLVALPLRERLVKLILCMNYEY